MTEFGEKKTKKCIKLIKHHIQSTKVLNENDLNDENST